MKYTSTRARINRTTAAALETMYRDVNRALRNADTLRNLCPDVAPAPAVIARITIKGNMLPAVIVEHVRAMGMTPRIRASHVEVIAAL